MISLTEELMDMLSRNTTFPCNDVALKKVSSLLNRKINCINSEVIFKIFFSVMSVMNFNVALIIII